MSKLKNFKFPCKEIISDPEEGFRSIKKSVDLTKTLIAAGCLVIIAALVGFIYSLNIYLDINYLDKSVFEIIGDNKLFGYFLGDIIEYILYFGGFVVGMFLVAKKLKIKPNLKTYILIVTIAFSGYYIVDAAFTLLVSLDFLAVDLVYIITGAITATLYTLVYIALVLMIKTEFRLDWNKALFKYIAGIILLAESIRYVLIYLT